MKNLTLAEGIVIRELANHAERVLAVQLQEETWGAGFTERVPAAILLVGQKIGGVSAGAFGADGSLLGFVFGLTGMKNGHTVHWSDMLAVRADMQGRHIGQALKQYQREKCRAAGVETMYWTFDPFVARNAKLNLCRLGAGIEEFVHDMYGANTNSRTHGSLGTDRFIASWALQQEPEPMPCDQALPADATVVAGRGDSAPSLEAMLPDDDRVVVRIPADYQELLAGDIEHARAWRMSARRAFLHYLSHGYRVSAFVADGDNDAAYLLTRPSK